MLTFILSGLRAFTQEKTLNNWGSYEFFVTDNLIEIEDQKEKGLHPKQIGNRKLTIKTIEQIKDVKNQYWEESLKCFIYNTLPGTTCAEAVKAEFLKQIILGLCEVAEISPPFAFELLSHMKGGPSVAVLLELALGD